MSGRTTLDTNSLRVRQVFALNPSTQNYVQPFQIPMIYEEGRLQWYSTMEFLSTISVPVTAGANWGTNGSNTLSNILTQIQPGLSTFALITQENFLSTVNHLQNTGVGGLETGQGYYVSTQTLNARIARLSHESQYVSTKTLWFAAENMANLGRILTAGPMTLVAPPLQLTLPPGVTNIGYVSTFNPGEYKTYYSSYNLYTGGGATGQNLINETLPQNSIYQMVPIDIGGLKSHFTSKSRLILETQLNFEITSPTPNIGSMYLSTLIGFDSSDDAQIVKPMISRMDSGQSKMVVSGTKFLLNPALFGTTNTLWVNINMTQTNPADGPFTLNTWIPESNCSFVTLDNQDY